MKNKKLLAAIAVFVVALVGASYYMSNSEDLQGRFNFGPPPCDPELEDECSEDFMPPEDCIEGEMECPEDMKPPINECIEGEEECPEDMKPPVDECIEGEEECPEYEKKDEEKREEELPLCESEAHVPGTPCTAME
jgi:hypothetical protein